MLGRTRLRVEPRLDGVEVVGEAGEATGWLGRRFPWASVRMRGAGVQIVDGEGRPIESGAVRAAWRREGAAQVATRACERALRRELGAGTLNRVYVTDPPIAARIVFGACLGLAGLCSVGALLPAFGASLLFPLGPAPTPLDRALASAVWVLWLVMLGVYIVIIGSAAFARSGRLRATAQGLELVEGSGRSTHWPRGSLSALRTSFVIEIVDRDGHRIRVTPAPGLASAVGVLERAWFPQAVADDRTALNRTLVRALAIWVLGCIGAGLAMGWTGAAPRTLVANPTLNIVLLTALNAVAIPAFVWASVAGRRRLEPWLARKFARRGARGRTS